MTRRKPAAPPEPPPAAPPAFDRGRLIAELRSGDEARISEAYRRVFGGEMARLVLAHMLKEAGVGVPRGPTVTPDERTWGDGAAFAALGIAKRAGFDQASVLLAVFTEDLEGTTDDRSYRRDDRSRADGRGDGDEY